MPTYDVHVSVKSAEFKFHNHIAERSLQLEKYQAE